MGLFTYQLRISFFAGYLGLAMIEATILNVGVSQTATQYGNLT